jgi:hypothetical protein
MLASDDERLEGAPRPGDVLEGKYEVERVLGAGGMGLVVAARHRPALSVLPISAPPAKYVPLSDAGRIS